MKATLCKNDLPKRHANEDCVIQGYKGVNADVGWCIHCGELLWLVLDGVKQVPIRKMLRDCNG